MRRLGVVILLCAFFCPPLLVAQTITGTILGRVADETAGVVPGVEVTITNVATNISRTTVTNDRGAYVVPLLPPGLYQIEATLPGFKTALLQDIRLRVDQEARHDITMVLGEVTEQVTVQAETITLGTENPAIGEVITEDQLVELPLSGRSIIELAMLSAGMSQPGNGQGFSVPTALGGGRKVAVAIGGQREYSTVFRFDGIPSKSRTYGPLGLQINADAVAEFKVERGYAAAGTGVTGRINVVTKSGTNKFHGSAWNFLRNDVLDAKNFFASEKLPLRQNQFGIAGGGPIIENKLFFFADYEGLRTRGAFPILGSVPTPETLAGNFSGQAPIIDPVTGEPFPGNIIPPNRISNFANSYNQFIPAPNRPGVVNRAIGASEQLDDDKYSFRLDLSPREEDSFFGRYTHHNLGRETEGFTPESGISRPMFARNAVVGWTHIFSPQLLNDFRVGLNRVVNVGFAPIRGPEMPDFIDGFGIKNVLSLPLCNGLPSVQMAAFTAIGPPTVCLPQTTNDFHFIENLSYSRGRHRLNVGFELQRVYMRQLIAVFQPPAFQFTTSFTGNSAANYLLGIPDRALGRDIEQPADRYGFWQAYYIDDEIQLSQEFTLSLGLRYDYFQALGGGNHRIGSFDREVPGGGFLYEKGSGLGDLGRIFPHQGMFFPDRNNWSPRIGLAYTPLPDTAIRASYGIFHQELIGNQLDFQQQQPPFVFAHALLTDPRTPTINMDTTEFFPKFTTDTPIRDPNLATAGYEPTSRIPYVQAWTLSIQQRFPGGMFAEVAYIGSKGTKISKRRELNNLQEPPPLDFTGEVQTLRPFPDFGRIAYPRNDGNDYYHGLQLTLKREMGGGLSFLTNYTWGKCIDQDSFESTRDYHLGDTDRSRCQQDQRHRYVFSWLYDLPFRSDNAVANSLLGGWMVTGITVLQSGFPTYPRTARDYSNRLILTQRLPNRICDGNLPTDQRKPERWFDGGCFPVPANNTVGNSGYYFLDIDGVINQDLALIKNFGVREPLRVQFRAEFFNLFNHPNFGAPVTRNVESTTFGRVLSALDPRIIQFGLKFLW